MKWVTGKSVSHAVRNRQREYSSRKRRSSRRVETWCGRHLDEPTAARGRQCRACLRALKSRGRTT
jgi:hypothetical protein